jgi:hypothetical protein
MKQGNHLSILKKVNWIKFEKRSRCAAKHLEGVNQNKVKINKSRSKKLQNASKQHVINIETEKETVTEWWVYRVAAGTDFRFEHCKDKAVFKFVLSCGAFLAFF